MATLYTTHAAAQILQVHPFTVAKWIDRGVLKAWRTAGGHRRLQAADLKAYLVEHGLPIPAELLRGDSRLKLLIVDDDAATLRAISRSFAPLSAEVALTTTSSGVEAMLLLAELHPDAMLIDLNMPDLDGYEVLRRVRKFPSLADVTLVAMTSHHTRDIVAQAMKAGAFACLAKPFDAGSVLKQIRGARPVAPQSAEPRASLSERREPSRDAT
jgi:excisionase family DNA binding protein